MTTLKFNAQICNRSYQKVLSVASPTLRHLSIKRVIITIETESDPSEEYIKQTIKLLENNPVSKGEYFNNVTFMGYR